MLDDVRVLDLSTESLAQPLRPVEAPWFGIDNHRVLTEVLGFSAERVEALEAAGVLR